MDTWFKPSKPEDIKPIPWLGKKVIEYLESILTKDMDVLEHGSGGSTLWFASRVKRVTACEHDSAWKTEIQKQAPENVVLMDARIPEKSVPFDLFLIDGEPIQNRAEWIQWATYLVKPGGWIVLDNANRPEYAKEREELAQKAKLIKRFDCNNGTQYLVTEFYKCE